MEELSQSLKREEFAIKPRSECLFLLMVIGFVIFILPLCMWEHLPGAGRKDWKCLRPPGGRERKRLLLGEETESRAGEAINKLEIQGILSFFFFIVGLKVLFSMRNWFRYRMMMSLISNDVFKEILQSLLVCLLLLVIHRCLTLCVCVCACATESDAVHLTYIRSSGITPTWNYDGLRPGLPNYYSPSSSCLLTVVLFIAFPLVWY